MGLMRVLPFAKHLLREHVVPGTVAIDMTAGNGHDTLFLAELVGDGHVYAFDVQEEAVVATRQRLEEAGMAERVSVIHDSHHTVQTIVADETRPITAAVFNLGYLPGSDKTVTTTGETTIDALRQLQDVMAIGGVITAMAILTRTELLLLVIAGVFVLSSGSVILQRAYFKVTRGKRLFLMSPFHHHLEMRGWAEVTIVVRMWIISGLLAVSAVGLFYVEWLTRVS